MGRCPGLARLECEDLEGGDAGEEHGAGRGLCRLGVFGQADVEVPATTFDKAGQGG